MDKSQMVSRPEFEEHDLGSKSKTVVAGPLALQPHNSRNKKPEAKVAGKDVYALLPDKRYMISAIADCYIAIGSEDTLVADNTDVLLFAKTCTIISTEGRPTFKFLSILGSSQVVELA